MILVELFGNFARLVDLHHQYYIDTPRMACMAWQQNQALRDVQTHDSSLSLGRPVQSTTDRFCGPGVMVMDGPYCRPREAQRGPDRTPRQDTNKALRCRIKEPHLPPELRWGRSHRWIGLGRWNHEPRSSQSRKEKVFHGLRPNGKRTLSMAHHQRHFQVSPSIPRHSMRLPSRTAAPNRPPKPPPPLAVLGRQSDMAVPSSGCVWESGRC